ncbi:MAG: hypothetical protein MUC40_06310, partial [Akkermansiaceae bacterium]|nr:hypothetical protein [Akkermansiaceae bacterium]
PTPHARPAGHDEPLRTMEILPFPIPGETPHPPPGAGFPATWPPPPAGDPVPLFGIPPAGAPSFEKSAPDFTDDELSEAFGPIVEKAVRKAVYSQENGIDTYLEPMLRATIRRALAEYSPASRPFEPPGVLDRLVWHVRALFTSRTYEDILFEKTRRFQVEEVFLLDSSTLALVCPSRVVIRRATRRCGG